jgi:mannose-6-phosphate isomerase-like protein (cupin superfamily)
MKPAEEASVTENVVVDGNLYAIIVRRDFRKPGVHFFTPGDFSQQVGYMAHPAGHRIQPHLHREALRSVRRTQEVLVIRTGRLKVDFYAQDRKHAASCVLEAGDVILLIEGGHGFEVLEACEMIEVKQGPYMGDEDKVRFAPVEAPERTR